MRKRAREREREREREKKRRERARWREINTVEPGRTTDSALVLAVSKAQVQDIDDADVRVSKTTIRCVYRLNYKSRLSTLVYPESGFAISERLLISGHMHDVKFIGITVSKESSL